ncbi:MAG TPA: hypothetical protein VGW12_00270 [Pyrinomonadaceae bacterium]|nr:hypothetical protein [Pyrinomonadaceae bacterium]
MGELSDWVYREVVEDTLPWSEAKEYSFQQFSEKYTLHDSVWIGLFYDVAYENNVILAIIWDAVWLPDEIARSTSIVAEWPLLFVNIEGLHRFLLLATKTSGARSVELGRLKSKK